MNLNNFILSFILTYIKFTRSTEVYTYCREYLWKKIVLSSPNNRLKFMCYVVIIVTSGTRCNLGVSNKQNIDLQTREICCRGVKDVEG